MSAGESITVSSTGGQKAGNLERYDLIPPEPLRQLAEHCGRGALKYEDHNWAKGYEWGKSFAALNRHLWQFWAGEDIDEETGSNHMVAVAWHAFALLQFMQDHPDFDTRPTAPRDTRPTTPKSVPDRVNDLTADEAYRLYEWDFGDLRFRYRNRWELTAQSNLKYGPSTVWQPAMVCQTRFSHGEYVRVQ